MDGVIVIDKPAGPTSAAIVAQVKACLGRHVRVGHLGTLDPFATGVLPILVGHGTKLAPFLQPGSKQYSGLIELGEETDTLDRTGEVIRRAPVPPIAQERLERVAARLRGSIEQTPPVYSAIKRGGVPLYKLARGGAQPEPPAPRRVEIMHLELQAVGDTRIRFTVVCSGGMYVRALARDLGNALGTAGCLSELRRIRSGGFDLSQAHPLNEVLGKITRGCPGLVSLREALAELPEVTIEAWLEPRVRHGDSRALDHHAPAGAEFFKVVSQEKLLAVARVTSRATAAIVRVFD